MVLLKRGVTSPSELEDWVDQAKAGMENALRAKPEDVREQYERKLKDLQEAYSAAAVSDPGLAGEEAAGWSSAASRSFAIEGTGAESALVVAPKKPDIRCSLKSLCGTRAATSFLKPDAGDARCSR
jgi:hypothetical protein